MTLLLKRLQQGVHSLRDSLAIHDLVVCADSAECQARIMQYATETPADFVLCQLFYILAHPPKPKEILGGVSPLDSVLKRIASMAPDYDPSLRFYEDTRPRHLDDFNFGLYEVQQARELALRIGRFIDAHKDFPYQESLERFFSLSRPLDQESIIHWFPHDKMYVDISLYG